MIHPSPEGEKESRSSDESVHTPNLTLMPCLLARYLPRTTSNSIYTLERGLIALFKKAVL